MRRIFGGVLLASAIAAPAAAQSTEAATVADLHCVMVTAILAGSAQDAEVRQASAAGAAYYMGRLKGRDPGIDLTARLTAELKRLRPDTLRAEARRCGAELKAFGQEAMDIGAALKALEAQPQNSATD